MSDTVVDSIVASSGSTDRQDSPCLFKTHRVWGHNLLIAGLGGGFLGAVGYLCHLSTRVHRALGTLTAHETFSVSALGTWAIVGLLAGVSHACLSTWSFPVRRRPAGP